MPVTAFPAAAFTSSEERIEQASMSVEAGATSGIVLPDDETRRYLKEVAGVEEPGEFFGPDPDADLVAGMDLVPGKGEQSDPDGRIY